MGNFLNLPVEKGLSPLLHRLFLDYDIIFNF